MGHRDVPIDEAQKKELLAFVHDDGKGLVAARGENGQWGTPLFVEIGGGSFGLQIGVEATDLILVFTKPDGLREMLKDKDAKRVAQVTVSYTFYPTAPPPGVAQKPKPTDKPG